MCQYTMAYNQHSLKHTSMQSDFVQCGSSNYASEDDAFEHGDNCTVKPGQCSSNDGTGWSSKLDAELQQSIARIRYEPNQLVRGRRSITRGGGLRLLAMR